MAAVLADFRTWLETNRVASAPQIETVRSDQGSQEPIDLHTLLGQFLAVRQEVNLQTRAVRAQQEQNAETLRQLASALEMVQRSQEESEEARQQARDEAIRPLLKTLIDLYDAFALADREVRRMRETGWTNQPTHTGRSLFRFFNREREREKERERQTIASVVVGYTMSLERLERALRQHGLETIPTVGERFDPERMEALEAVADSVRPAGEVIDEVRRGYFRDGRVFRYAQVRVAK